MLPLHDLAVKTNYIKPKLGKEATVAVSTRWLEKGLLHVFCDASTIRYGGVCYIRTIG